MFRILIRSLIFGFCSMLVMELFACSLSEPRKPPVLPDLKNKNIIMISLDTLRKDRLGAYGHPDSITPFLDRLTSSSVVFEDVASQSASTWTSHRSLFVSKYVSSHTPGDPVPGTTLADHFKLAGYRTAAFVDGGKMHHRYGHSVGFDEFDDQGGHLKKIIPKARQWLIDRKQDKFFLFLHTYDIHAPYNPLDNDGKVFLGNKTVPDEFRTGAPIYLNTLHLPPDQLERLSSLYNGGVRSCDHQLAEFFNFLKAEGFLDNTLIVIISDHGESLGERGKLGHHEMYYAQLAVPLIFRIPDFASRIVRGTVENLDIMPTVLNLVNLEIPQDLQGISQKDAIISGRVFNPLRYHLSENKRRTLFRDMDWKLITGRQKESDELYFLADDPAETNNQIINSQIIHTRLLNDMVKLIGATETSLRKPASSDLKLEIFKKDDAVLKQQLEILGYLEKK